MRHKYISDSWKRGLRFLGSSSRAEVDGQEDLSKMRIPDVQSDPFALGRRLYIDEILNPAEAQDALCAKVETLMDVCNYWSLSASAVVR